MFGAFGQEMARTKQTTRKSTARPTATKVWVEASAEDGGGKRAKVEKAEKTEKGEKAEKGKRSKVKKAEK